MSLYLSFQVRVDEMITTAEELCGSRVVSDRLKSDLRSSVTPRLTVDQEFLSSVVVTQPATQISLKARYVLCTLSCNSLKQLDGARTIYYLKNIFRKKNTINLRIRFVQKLILFNFVYSEMGLTAATHLAEKITDEVVDLLNKTQNDLVSVQFVC